MAALTPEEKKKRGNYGDAAAATADETVTQVDATPAVQQLQAVPSNKPMDETAVADRVAASNAWTAIKDANQRAGAAIADIATLPIRGVVGAYDSVVVRPMRAAGINAAYLSPKLVPEGANADSMTPFYDQIRKNDPQPAMLPAASPAAPPAASYVTRMKPEQYDARAALAAPVELPKDNVPPPLTENQQPAAVQQMAAPSVIEPPKETGGYIPAQVRNSGNDWQMRNNLRNAEVSASSITEKNNPNSPAMLKYRAMLDADEELMKGKNPVIESQNRDAAFMDRTQAGERGLNYRTQVANSIAQQRVDNEAAKQGIESNAAKQLQSLQQQFINETDPRKRATLQETLQTLTGRYQRQEPANKFTVVPGGQAIDPTTSQPYTVPARVLDNQTGKWVDQGGQASGGGQSPVIKTKAEYDALPKGSRYIRDGITKIKE